MGGGGFWNIILQWITLPCISTNTTKVRNIYVCNQLQRVRIGFATLLKYMYINISYFYSPTKNTCNTHKHTHTHTHIYIPRFALREKVTLRLLKLLFQGVDVVEWSRALDVRLSEWLCSVSMVWVQIPSREEHIFDSSKI